MDKLYNCRMDGSTGYVNDLPHGLHDSPLGAFTVSSDRNASC